MELGPFLWLLALTVGVVVLGGSMIYGMKRNSERSRVEKAMTEAGTRREYEVEERDAK